MFRWGWSLNPHTIDDYSLGVLLMHSTHEPKRHSLLLEWEGVNSEGVFPHMVP